MIKVTEHFNAQINCMTDD